MEITEPRLRFLLRQAEKVADAGKRAAAETLYRQIVAEAPEAEVAWLGLAGVVASKEEKAEAYQRVLALNPENEAAQAGMAELRGEAAPPESFADWGDYDAEDAFSQSRQWLEAATARRQPTAPAAAEPQPIAPPLPEPVDHEHEPDAIDGDVHQLACYRHPGRRTSLRCYTCNRPICIQCARLTPVGYRCPDCIREAEEVFYNATALDYLLAPLVSLPVSLLAGFLVINVGRGFFFILIMFFIGGAVGSLIGRIASRAIGRRRGRYLPQVVATTVIVGVVIPALPILLAAVSGQPAALTLLIAPAVYLFVATSAAYYQMR